MSMAQSHQTSPPQTPSHSSSKEIKAVTKTDNKRTVEHLLKCINECLHTFAAEKQVYNQPNSLYQRNADGHYN